MDLRAILWAVAVVTTPAAVEAQPNLRVVEAAGRIIEQGDLRRGCVALESTLRVWRASGAARRELLHRHRLYARSVRRCAAQRLARALAVRAKARRFRLLADLRASPLLVDREQRRRVERACDEAARVLRENGEEPRYAGP